MKRIALLIILMGIISFTSLAQRFAYVDTEYILSRIPTFRAAQEQLDRIATQYQSEIEEEYKVLEKKFQDFENEKILLTQEMRKKREDEIIQRERAVKEIQMRYFGRDGMLFQKREELIKPIQDQVANAVNEVANEGGFAIIFDTAGASNILFTNPRYDRSDDVLQKLGYN